MTEESPSHSIYTDYAERVRRRKIAGKKTKLAHIIRAAKKVIAKRFARCGPECIMSINTITSLTRKQLQDDGFYGYSRIMPKVVEKVILDTFSATLWPDPTDRSPLGKRKYAVKGKSCPTNRDDHPLGGQ